MFAAASSLMLALQSPASVSALRLQFAGMAIATVVFCSGAAAVCVFAFRRAGRETSLLYFGVMALLYSVRLFLNQPFLLDVFAISRRTALLVPWVITFVIPIPLLLFMRRVFQGRGRRLFDAMLIVAAILGGLGISAGVFGVALSAANTANGVFIIVLCVLVVGVMARENRNASMDREKVVFTVSLGIFVGSVLHANLLGLRVVHGPNLEPVGFLIFVACLGYIAVGRSFAKEEELLSINKELEIARQIQSSILPREIPRLPGAQIAARYLPMGAVAGDFYDFLRVDEKRAGVLVADVTGHGVPAALIASMLKVAFAAQASHAADPAKVLAGLNAALCGRFEEHFVTAAYLYLDTERRIFRYAGAGHPPLLLARASGPAEEIEENGLCLGMFPEAAYSYLERPLHSGDRLLLYTDGVLEAKSESQEEFGKQRCMQLLAAQAQAGPSAVADALATALARWSNASHARAQEDDITIVAIRFD